MRTIGGLLDMGLRRGIISLSSTSLLVASSCSHVSRPDVEAHVKPYGTVAEMARVYGAPVFYGNKETGKIRLMVISSTGRQANIIWEDGDGDGKFESDVTAMHAALLPSPVEVPTMEIMRTNHWAFIED